MSSINVNQTLSHPIVSGAALEGKDITHTNVQVIMCLQMCPRKKTIYLSVGIPSIKGPENGASANVAPGAWFVDKVIICIFSF